MPSAPPVLLIDAFLAAACLAVSLVALVISDERDSLAADVPGVLLLVLATVPLVWRRRWAVATAAITVVVVFVYYWAGYPGAPPTPAVLVALYTLAVTGHRSWARLVVVLFAGVGVAYRALVENDEPVAIVVSAALFVLVLLLGDAVHSRHALANEVQERVRIAAARRETEAQRKIAEERLSIARDVHDVVAHTLAAVGVQAAVAEDLFDHDPQRARAALTTLRGACNDAVGELHAAIAPLRDDRPAATDRSVPGLASLDELGHRLSSEDLRITVEIEAAVTTVTPESVQIAAYRIVQEALTNVVRHAEATRAEVAVRLRGATLLVTVEDDGIGPTTDSLGGSGLIGMRERAEAVGGSLDAGLSAGGGFRVEARLPVGGADR